MYKDEQDELVLQMEYARGTRDGLSQAGRKAMDRASIRWTNHKDDEARMWREFADDLFSLVKLEQTRYDKLLETRVHTDENGED
jgi:hypothetical protein